MQFLDLGISAEEQGRGIYLPSVCRQERSERHFVFEIRSDSGVDAQGSKRAPRKSGTSGSSMHWLAVEREQPMTEYGLF